MRPDRVRPMGDFLRDYARERGSSEWEPIRLGFGAIDVDMRGVSPGQVLGFAARTGVGKSQAQSTIVHRLAAERPDLGVLVLSLEMPGAEWVERQLAIDAGVAPEQVEEWARHDKESLTTAAHPFVERMRNVLLCEDRVSLEEMPAVFEEARQKLAVPLRVVVIDYLGMLDVQGRDSYERASKLGRGLKHVAKSESVAVIVAMQLSRAAGDGSEPVSLEQLRDSGVLEESLDFLLGAWRPGRARGLSPADSVALRDVVRVALLKNRKGPDGREVDLRFSAPSRELVADELVPASG